MMKEKDDKRRRTDSSSGAILLALVALILCTGAQAAEIDHDTEKVLTYNKLTPEEDRVIIGKGTEAPFSGRFDNHQATGTYVCRRCNTPLYESEDKFSSGCGWPSFDDEIPGAVKRQSDSDGSRTEITCAACGGHLGHVFLHEGLTPKDTRHCVNSISLDFVPAESSSIVEKAYFAGGCFWGTEHLLSQQEGVLDAQVGYMGGAVENPTYRDVCAGQTGHTETVEVTFDPTKTSFETLARYFFEIHDPTQSNRQGPDVGSQYRSAVFVTDENQEQVIRELITILKKKGYDVVTEIQPSRGFWPAEDYHQDYYENNGKTPYCHFYQKRF